jgi:DNA-binding MarR family transcriptional regulator
MSHRKKKIAAAQAPSEDGGALWLHEFIPYKLAVVANRLSQSIGALFEERFGIQIPEWRILMALHAHGPTAPNEVVEHTSMDKARVSRAQRRLVEQDLVAVSEDPRDRRRLVLFLTRKGTAICRDIIPEVRRMEAWFLEVLDPRERAALDLTLSRLFARSQELRRLGGQMPVDGEADADARSTPQAPGAGRSARQGAARTPTR